MSTRRVPFFILLVLAPLSWAPLIASAEIERRRGGRGGESAKRDDDATTDPLRQLDQLDRTLTQLALAQRETNARVEVARRRLSAVEGRMSLAEEAMADRRTLIQQRLGARARVDALTQLRILVEAHDPTEVVYRRVYLRHILAHDARLLTQLTSMKADLLRLKGEHGSVTAQIEAERELLLRQRESLETERRLKVEQVAVIRRSKRLSSRFSQRENTLDLLKPPLPATEAATLEDDFIDRRGELPVPTPGRIVSTFGTHEDPELGTLTFEKGIEIDAPMGAPVRAVHSGRVVYAGWYKGYGNLVIVEHGGGYHTLYAHLSTLSLEAGTGVEGGDVVGDVGDTGSLKGPHLYFELRAGTKAVNPMEWLSRLGRP